MNADDQLTIFWDFFFWRIPPIPSVVRRYISKLCTVPKIVPNQIIVNTISNDIARISSELDLFSLFYHFHSHFFCVSPVSLLFTASASTMLSVFFHSVYFPLFLNYRRLDNDHHLPFTSLPSVWTLVTILFLFLLTFIISASSSLCSMTCPPFLFLNLHLPSPHFHSS